MLSDAKLVGERWALERHIGSGSFAVVWKAQHVTTGETVAIKEIKEITNKKLMQSLAGEISILKQITHKNIVQLLEVVEEHGRIYLVMEYCAGGDLAAFIRQRRSVSEVEARALMQQLAAGLKELWSRNLVHRDLKPQNLLLAAPGPGAVLKIADFGFARSLQPSALADTLCGSPLYMAPEILQFQKYDAKADLWSIGTILFELVVGKPPFNGANHVQLLRNIERAEAALPAPVAAALSPRCRALLHGLLRRNPLERISFEEFFLHAFLAGSEAPPAGGTGGEGLRGCEEVFAGISGARGAHVSGHVGPRDRGAPRPDAASGGRAAPTHAPTPPAAAQGPSLRLLLGDDLSRALGPGLLQAAPARASSSSGELGPALPGSQLGPSEWAGSAPRALPPPPPPLLHSARSGAGSADSRPGLDEEDDYVMIDGPSPFSSGQHLSRGSAPGPPAFGGGGFLTPLAALSPVSSAPHAVLPLSPPPPMLLPLLTGPRVEPAPALPSAAAGVSMFAGAGRGDLLVRAGQLLDRLAGHRCQIGEPHEAVALRLLALQVLQAALEAAQQRALRGVAARAEAAAVAAAVAGCGAGGPLPDAWQAAFRAALHVARSGAVDELLGNFSSSLKSYVIAGTLLTFMALEAPTLLVTPKLDLPAHERARMQRYAAAVAARHSAAAGALRAAALKP
ncbi:hypothetical protein WJX81_003954 [Elliptochloris bilobata]|uniref:Protein kinase domain-containing protein n=1 Tax=Elliptochloris bilobata TaxID=381761 RepID=A0AAW1QJK2_9CHLO